MSSTTSTPNNKKPGLPSAARRTPVHDAKDSSTAGSPSTSRTSTPTAQPNGLNRTRSVRNGAPISARAAVRKTPTPAADDDAKAELRASLEELQEKLTQAELASAEKDKQAAVLQAKLDDARKEQGMLEESVHEQTERIEELENDKKESVRARRELEQIYESERAAMNKEKEEAAAREEEMQNALQRMKETLAQREMRAGLEDEGRRPSGSRQTSHGRGNSPGSPHPDQAERQFAPSSMQRSDSISRNNSKLVMQKDKIIESLRLELAEAQIKLVEMENMGGGRLQELQKQVYETKMQNARLMEENESFQLLLSEKTLNGDFLRPSSYPGSRPPSGSADDDAPGHSLADELGSEADGDGGEIPAGSDTERRLRGEVNAMKDQNKALTLYINNIISRLLQHEQFEQILDKTPDLMAGPGAISRRYQAVDTDKELPPPPGEDTQPSLLQRAKSVIAPKKTRPLSQQMAPPFSVGSSDTTKVNEDPETAPSVPIARRMASGAERGHRRANSEWPAASVVTNMYRGPSGTQAISPLSPGLSSPTTRSGFFNRVPSGGIVPTVSTTNPTPTSSTVLPPPPFAPGGIGKENGDTRPPQRDSKFANSNRNSMASNPGTYELLDAPESVTTLQSPNPNNSPPRSTTSSGLDKDGKDNKGLSGAVMMGSKVRPLRLVQEAKDEDLAKKGSAGAAGAAGNRGSWFGWMNKGGLAPAGLGGSGGQ